MDFYSLFSFFLCAKPEQYMAIKNKKGFSFDDLTFEEHPLVKGMKEGKLQRVCNHKGIHGTHLFENGIHVSIIQLSMTYRDKKTRSKKRLFLAYQSSMREYEMMITARTEEARDKFNEYIEKNSITDLHLDNPLGYLLKSEISKILQTLEKI
jgi:hypothetical protein